MAKQKYYVVWEGHNPGIYSTWAQCKQEIEGYPAARYKSFKTMDMAKEAFYGDSKDFIGKNVKESTLSREELDAIGEPILKSIAVDAACDLAGKAMGPMEYQGVDTAGQTPLFHQGPFADGTNNVGEFLAIVHGLAYLKKQNSKLPIYTDSRTAISWVRKKKANTKLQRTPRNTKLFEMMARAEAWLKNNTWDNPILKWETKAWGEIPADFGRK